MERGEALSPLEGLRAEDLSRFMGSVRETVVRRNLTPARSPGDAEGEGQSEGKEDAAPTVSDGTPKICPRLFFAPEPEEALRVGRFNGKRVSPVEDGWLFVYGRPIW